MDKKINSLSKTTNSYAQTKQNGDIIKSESVLMHTLSQTRILWKEVKDNLVIENK